MASPFWIQGAVPIGQLDRLALPDPRLPGLLRRLQTDGQAAVGGGPGSGRTTAAHQAMHAWPARAALVDGAAMLRDDEATWLRHIMQGLGTTTPPAEPSLDQFRRGLHGRPRPLVVLDGEPATDVVEGIVDTPAAVLVVQADGSPPRHEDSSIAAFLEERMATIGGRFAAAGLEACTEAAGGSIVAAQRIGHEAVRMASTVTADVALEAIAAAAWEPPAGLRDRLARTSPHRRRLLLAIARDPEAAPSVWGRRCAIAQAAVPVHLARLVAEGLCHRPERGRYVIASPLLAQHLRWAHGTPSYGTTSARQRPGRLTRRTSW